MTIELQAQPAPDGSAAAVYTPPTASHLENVVYLVGHPIAHSSSPKLHDSISRSSGVSYTQLLAETTDLESLLGYLWSRSASQQPGNTGTSTEIANGTAIPGPRILGSGVTMPHKVAILDHINPNHITNEAKAIGAVNTLYLKKGVWWGTNTDTIGIRDAFTLNLSEEVLGRCRGGVGLVVGGGGTCRTAIYTLQKMMGCRKVYIINRDSEEVEAVLRALRGGGGRGAGTKSESEGSEELEDVIYVSSLTQALQLDPPSLIVSAIPDYSPSSPTEHLVRQILETFLTRGKEEGVDAGLLEMCYHPSPNTQITKLAMKCEWRVIGGLEAMMAQGLEQAKLWTGIEVDERLRRDARKAIMPA